nr:retrotransposable element Tf2 [Tanacetum cinerariifolium]
MCVWVNQSKILGHVITGAGVATDDTKIETMSLIPSNLKQLRGFLGLTGYYRRFIKGYALISQPLTKLLKKNAFVWTKEAQSAFIHLKEAIVNAPVLKFPDFNEPFIVETYALGEGIGAVLQQSAGKPCSKHYSWSNQQLTRKGKLVVGDDPALRFSLLTHFHGDSTGGHSGIAATTQRIHAFCYWRKMKKQVKEFVSMCAVCQRSKPSLSAYPGLLQPLPISTLSWSEISMDFVEGLSNSGGKTVIMVVVDRLSKYSHFMALSHPFTVFKWLNCS